MKDFEVTVPEGWEPRVYQAMIGGQWFDVFAAERAMDSKGPGQPAVLDETYLWVPRVN